jgi:SAM-dependent methyltransferase
MSGDKFVDIKLNRSNLDIYLVRKGIQDAILHKSSSLKGEMLDFGCGKMPYKKFLYENTSIKSYVGLDIESALSYEEGVKPDFQWDGVNMPFDNDAFDTVFGTEVLEHCPDTKLILKELYRVLREDGTIFFTVPFLWCLHEVPHDEFRFTPFALKRILEEVGFEDVEIHATGGWHASFAQMWSLWLKRGIGQSWKSRVLIFLSMPFIKLLMRYDKKPKNFKNGQMITSLYGSASKKSKAHGG